ncbi:MAG: hypothetical protein GFH27_549409n19 [Chloroflexi bacterium AL-W]|nr:hypothetical protein [Chloroflexi bacterium AL-N1]NOK71354.1 hypothetical protein [Chloroflexi bacterium AL-N10]NOK78757.1 hypothetical protein [Chloroflexi bacterium AL-N5]NOK86127.1 hypothetical protein [Chloroflexi bacterium AL-W]NOK93080.1 hypothetical protein [Chloroflexi bacterium AL-N15]
MQQRSRSITKASLPKQQQNPIPIQLWVRMFALLLCLTVGSLSLMYTSIGAVAQSSPNTLQTISYQPTDDLFPNPERGWFQSLTPDYSLDAPVSPLTLEQVQQYRAEGVTLVRKIYHLKEFTNYSISEDYLDTIVNDLQVAREAGVKLIPRFAYVWRPDKPAGVDPRTPDAPINVVMQHLDQLEPIFTDNVDVIAYVEAGFVGYYGEWRDSSNEHIDNWTLEPREGGQQIIQKLLEVVPESRMVMMHYPSWREMKSFSTEPTTVSNVYGEQGQDRLGSQDNGFLAKGTISQQNNVAVQEASTQNNVAVQEASTQPDTQYSIIGGEAHTTSNPREVIASLGYSTLNRNAEASTEYAVDWQETGIYDEIERTLGYRYRLVQATIPSQAQVGTTTQISLDITNDGSATIYNPRGAELVFRHSKTEAEFKVNLQDSDSRDWLPQPGMTETIDITANFPVDVEPGVYELFLHFPDPAFQLYGRPEYSIRLANTDMWEAQTGYNKLNATILLVANESVSAQIGYTQREDGTILKSGEPFFPIGVFAPNRAQSDLLAYLDEITKAGFNTTMSSVGSIDSTYTAFLNEAAHRGVAIIPEAGSYDADANDIVAVAKAYKDKPAVMGYHIANDAHEHVSVPALAQKKAALEQIDPNAISFMADYDFELFDEWLGVADFTAPYHHPVPWGPLGLVDHTLTEAGKCECPLYANIQAFAWPDERMPTTNEVRNMTYQALTHNVRGVMYNWHDGDEATPEQAELWNGLKTITPELQQLAPVLLHGDYTRVDTGKDAVPAAHWEYDGQVYVIAVNTTDTAQIASVALPNDVTGPATPLFDSSTDVELGGNALSGILQPTAVHVYVLDMP